VKQLVALVVVLVGVQRRVVDVVMILILLVRILRSRATISRLTSPAAH
jgi:hypothetical protein